MHLGPFGCLTKTQCKTGRTGGKVRATKSRHNFSQRTHRIDPLGPKLTFWCVLYYLGAFGTVCLPYKTRCKTSRSGAKVRAMKSCQNFSQRTHPIHPIGPKTHVSSRFILFWCIWDCSVVLQYSVQNGPSWCKSSCHEVASEFFATSAPDQPHWTLNSCFGVFVLFRRIWDCLVALKNALQNRPN